MTAQLERFVESVYASTEEIARRNAGHLRWGTVLSIDGPNRLAMVRLEGGTHPAIDVDDEGNEIGTADIGDEGVEVLILDGAVCSPGDVVAILQQHSTFLLLGRVGQYHTSTTWETRSPTPFGGWEWYPDYGPGTAQRTGFTVTVTGLVRRSAATFTPTGTSMYEYLNVPWPASVAHTGLIWSSAGPLRWYLAAGSTTVKLMVLTGVTPGALTSGSAAVSCQISYTISPSAAGGTATGAWIP